MAALFQPSDWVWVPESAPAAAPARRVAGRGAGRRGGSGGGAATAIATVIAVPAVVLDSVIVAGETAGTVALESGALVAPEGLLEIKCPVHQLHAAVPREYMA